MAKWTFQRDAYPGGRFQLVITKTHGKLGRVVDVTRFRGAETQIDSFSDADPFGDATAQFTFPAVTPFDDLDSGDVGAWLGYYSNVDLYWVPAVPAGPGYPSQPIVINALTQHVDVITPQYIRDSTGRITGDNRIKLFEGFISAMDFNADESSATLQISCQGALFQLDRYLAKPFFPPQPWPLEKLIQDAFGHLHKPHLRTGTLSDKWIQFPSGWSLKFPHYSKRTASIYTPVGKPGAKWSGYSSRQTGSWDHTLTGFVQDQLAVMLTDDRSGVTVGNQWTVQHLRHTAGVTPGRQPVLTVRDRFRAPDFTLWAGTPGVTLHLTGDSTQSENIIYGDGTGVDGTVWRNAVISKDGSRTDYLPLAAAREVYPINSDGPAWKFDATGNNAHAKLIRAFQQHAFVSEAYTKYGTGFDQTAATSSAKQALTRDREPGWTGTISLKVDPSSDMPRWLVRAGMTMKLKGFAGSGDDGINFHISSTTKSPMQGTVELTVDTRYRDLLTVEEAASRTRDPLTPVKMLQVNRTSVLIEDVQAPWDYTAGSGFIPHGALRFHAHRPNSVPFPYTSWAESHPPLHYPHMYVKCNADMPTRKGRWAGPVPVLTSEKGTIIRTEIYASDVWGHPVKVPFHVSFYYVNVTVAAMPRNAQGPSPYIDGAFESINPKTGQQWPAGNFLSPDQSFIQGWGNRSNGIYNRAGFWPGRESDGATATGLLVDDSNWSFDNTSNPNYDRLAKPGKRQKNSAITIYAMFYCEFTEPVYFQGRLFRQNPGVS